MDPKHRTGYRAGIVNSMTLVGNEIKSILRERSVPFDKIVLLDSTGEAAGAITDVGDEPAVVSAVSDAELEDLDIVFFCGSAAANHEWIEKADHDKFVAIDLSQPSTVEGGGMVVSGVNDDEMTGDERLIISPHPIAVALALILHQIGTAVPIQSCTANVIQPASQYDEAGVEELAKQTVSVLNVQSVPQTVFDRQLAFNLYPAKERNEAFIASQLKTLIDPKMEMALFITQGTIFHGHTLSLFLRTSKTVDESRLITALRQNDAIDFAEGDQQFGTIDAAGRDQVLIAEVRSEPSIERGFWVWAVCDNLRRGSALNAVLIAEKFLSGAAN